ncbi:putative glycosyltransferase [Mycobacterium saskatchewanense]|uniref:Glycosyltransferase n=1 Tax=Mycobacterium saskatchewanense TaxID=220927 RepID=A0A1X2BY72_9MYCO|nr:glycosyltransferase [Mycobacterium saskatchewanense]ORW68059.1 glycosyltransferase [Mycobacterium saskatchewanense]BBX66497.1 putative glycosyltransferase [Mycobacterium saskatchewanense]
MKIVVAAYGSRGDVEPCAAVARELARRGHDVRMTAPPNMLGFVESAGLPAVAYGADTRGQTETFANLIGTVPNPIGALPEVLASLTETWSSKSATLASLVDGADLLLAGINEQELAANVAEWQGIPVAGLHFFPPQILSFGPLYSGLRQQAANAQRRALGLPDGVDGAAAFVEIQGYDEFCVPGVAATWAGAAARRPFVGALTLQLPADDDDEALSWIAAGAPPVCFGLGSTPIAAPADMVAMIGTACALVGERALICSGPNDFRDVPRFDHVKVVRSVNHAAVLPACRAVVHHGGAGSTAAGLRAGIPTLVLWLWLDQPMWAAALEQLGLGASRQFTATTAESLAADLESILTADYAARASDAAARMTPAADSAAKAAELLEGLAWGR